MILKLPPGLVTDLLATLASSPIAQQLFPLLVFFLIPLLALSVRSPLYAFTLSFSRMLAHLASAFPWNWGHTHSDAKAGPGETLVRTRAGQLARMGETEDDATTSEKDHAYYSGLVNISGTYCFMNATMQALASLTYLQPYLDVVRAKAEALDVPSPVTDALRDLLHTLNSPQPWSRALRPHAIIDALSHPTPSSSHRSPLFSSREHQDAQELFQLVTECVKKEALAIDRECARDRGFGGLHALPGPGACGGQDVGKGVFDGLTANRRSCVECGYTEAVMHFSFDNWQLPIPRMTNTCRLEDCLAEYTKLELLTDCICRRCSMAATLRRLEQEAERLSEALRADPSPSSSKKKRAREAKKLAARVKNAVEEGRIEEDIKGVKMERVLSRVSTKQAMIARPPPVLALHLNRSLSYGAYATKNSCRVVFPELLDLTPYTTSGQLSTVPSAPISYTPPTSSPLSSLLPSTTSLNPFASSFNPSTSSPFTPSTSSSSHLPGPARPPPTTLYRLAAVVCHYGQHSFGHYVCFRRKPRPPSAGPNRWAPPRAPHSVGCACERCGMLGPVWDDEGGMGKEGRGGRGWLRISDDSVRECGVGEVLSEGAGAFMIYYELVLQAGGAGGSVREGGGAREGEGEEGDEERERERESVQVEVERALGARVVRSVEVGRRTPSASESGSTGASSSAGTSVTSVESESGGERKDMPRAKDGGERGSVEGGDEDAMVGTGEAKG